MKNKLIAWILAKYGPDFGYYRCEWGFATGRYWLEIGNAEFVENVGPERIKSFVERSFGPWMKEHIKP